ncbi:hypothetical protein AtubIFM54640_009587 [Aspergillus tubingensis]|nr:hypothetical protein AtubIFM54640_009587 [Aspergillus tubingensis]
MLSTFHIENFRPWAFPPPTKSPSPTQPAPPTPYPPPARFPPPRRFSPSTRFPLPKQHPPSNFPRSHSPCNKSSAIKLCDEPRPRILPLPKHPLPARPPADACVNTSAKGAPYTFSGSQLSPPQSPIPSSDTLPDERHPETPERTVEDREGGVSDSITLWDDQNATVSLTEAPALPVIASSPSTLDSEHSPPLSAKHNDIPIDPVILADDGSWMIGELQSIQPKNHFLGSETSFPYPDPPVALCDTSFYHTDFNTQAERQDSDLRSVGPHGQGHTQTSPDDAEANVPSRVIPPESSSQRSKLRKRKPQPSSKQPSKRARHPISGSEEDTSLDLDALLAIYFSAPFGVRVQFCNWMCANITSRAFDKPDTETSEDKAEKPAGEMDHPSSRLEHHGASRRGKKWSSEEEKFLRELKNDKNRPWSDVVRLFSNRYPGRSSGSIQVHWSTKQDT